MQTYVALGIGGIRSYLPQLTAAVVVAVSGQLHPRHGAPRLAVYHGDAGFAPWCGKAHGTQTAHRHGAALKHPAIAHKFYIINARHIGHFKPHAVGAPGVGGGLSGQLQPRYGASATAGLFSQSLQRIVIGSMQFGSRFWQTCQSQFGLTQMPCSESERQLAAGVAHALQSIGIHGRGGHTRHEIAQFVGCITFFAETDTFFGLRHQHTVVVCGIRSVVLHIVRLQGHHGFINLDTTARAGIFVCQLAQSFIVCVVLYAALHVGIFVMLFQCTQRQQQGGIVGMASLVEGGYFLSPRQFVALFCHAALTIVV